MRSNRNSFLSRQRSRSSSKVPPDYADRVDSSSWIARRALVRRTRGNDVSPLDFCCGPPSGCALIAQFRSTTGSADSSERPGVRQSQQRSIGVSNAAGLLQNSATSARSTAASNSQLSTDLSALGNGPELRRSIFGPVRLRHVLGDLKNSASAAQVHEGNAASQSVQLVEGLLSTLNASATSSTSAANTTSSCKACVAANAAWTCSPSA